MSMFSGSIATEGQGDFLIKFEQICEDNEIPKSSWAQLLFSKTRGEPAQFLQRLHQRERGSYDDEMAALSHIYINRSTRKMVEMDLA